MSICPDQRKHCHTPFLFILLSFLGSLYQFLLKLTRFPVSRVDIHSHQCRIGRNSPHLRGCIHVQLKCLTGRVKSYPSNGAITDCGIVRQLYHSKLLIVFAEISSYPLYPPQFPTTTVPFIIFRTTSRLPSSSPFSTFYRLSGPFLPFSGWFSRRKGGLPRLIPPL